MTSLIQTTDKHVPTLAEFGKLDGEQFGGGSSYLKMDPETVRGPFTHVRVDLDVKLSEDTKAINLHVAEDESGVQLRMPASAVFRNNAEEAALKPGDVYYVARLPNAIKLTGSKATGKGKEMEIYALKVVSRSKKK